MGTWLDSLSHIENLKMQGRGPPKSTVSFWLNSDSLVSGIPERLHLKSFQGTLNKISLAPFVLSKFSSLYMKNIKSGPKNEKQFSTLKNLNKRHVKSINPSSRQLTVKNLWLETKVHKMVLLFLKEKYIKCLGQII